jgi:arginase
MTGNWVFIGAPSSAGAHHGGQELAPAALRAAGLLTRLRQAGVPVTDGGDLPVTAFQVGEPPYRNLAAVTAVASALRDRVAQVLADGGRPLVAGGDCTLTLGVVAAFGRDVRLVYLDGDMDLGPAGNSDAPSSGILDSTGIGHLLGGGAAELAGLGGTVPLIDPARLTLLGGDPRETSDEGRLYLKGRGVTFQEGPALAADPVDAARRALAAVSADDGPVLVHFDVDVIDSGDLPLANFPHYDSGVRADQAFACLRELCAHPSLAGLVLTEVNPTHDPSGQLLARYVDGVVSALARLTPPIRDQAVTLGYRRRRRWCRGVAASRGAGSWSLRAPGLGLARSRVSGDRVSPVNRPCHPYWRVAMAFVRIRTTGRVT